MKKLFIISSSVGLAILSNGLCELAYAKNKEEKKFETQIDASEDVFKALAKEAREIKGKKGNIDFPAVLKKLKSDSPEAHKEVTDAAQFIKGLGGKTGFTPYMDGGKLVGIDPSAISFGSVYGKLAKVDGDVLKKATLVLTYNEGIRVQLEAIIGKTQARNVVWDDTNSMLKLSVDKAGLRQFQQGIDQQGIAGKIIFDCIEQQVSSDTITRVEALTPRKIGGSEAFFSLVTHIAEPDKKNLSARN